MPDELPDDRRDGPLLDADVRELAVSPSLGVLTTLMPDGCPQSSVVWAHADERHILVGTFTVRQKYRNALADQRVTIVLLTGQGGYIEVRGHVVGFETGAAALELARTTFTKWTGSPEVRAADGERVLLRIAPDHIHRRV